MIFNDMRLRVINASLCQVKTLAANAGRWEYGTLFLRPCGAVTFGDLTISVTPEELYILIDIAVNSKSAIQARR